MEKFAKGTVVRLKSGGPYMTVHGINNENYECRWFDKEGKLISDIFSEETLVSKKELDEKGNEQIREFYKTFKQEEKD